MGIFSGIANLTKRSLRVEEIKQYAQDLKSAAKIFFIPKSTSFTQETFEQALTRLNLNQNDINKREKEFQNLVKIFSLTSLGLVIYLSYVIYQKALIASLGTAGILFIVLAQLFRYHFWLFQIRQKRLGCTFKEWMRYLFRKERESVK